MDWEKLGPQKYISGRLMRKGEFMDTKVSFRGYMAWNYDREEQDLDRMSGQGWQLIKGGCFFSIYTRQPGILYRHRIDYNPDVMNDPEEKRRYLELFEEQGWEFVGKTFNGWIYLKKQYIPGTPEEEYEIYTDSESLAELVKRWKKLAYLLSALAISQLGLYVALGINAGYLSPVLIIIYVGMFCWIQWGIHQLKRKLLGDGIN